MADEGIQQPRKAAPRRRDENDDDFGDSQSVRKASSGSSMGWILLLVLGGGGLLLVCCGGVGALSFFWAARVEHVAIKPAMAPPPVMVADVEVGKGGVRPINEAPIAPALKVPSTRLTVDARFNEVKDIAFASQGQTVAYLFWDTRGKLQNFVDYWDWKTQKRLARIELANFGNGIEIDPKGSRLLNIQNAPVGLSAWSLPDGKQIFKDWNPYQKDPKKPFDLNAPDLVWASYLDDNRLLSISRTGQVDVWDVNQKQVLATNPVAKASVFLTQNFAARAPQNFALSGDRRFLAMANGDGYDFFEAAAAKRLGKTATLAAEGKPGVIWSTAFNREGTQFASKYSLFNAGKSQEYISVWEVPSGVRKWHLPVPPDFNRNGPMMWINANHLMIWDGNIFNGTVFRLSDGKYLRICEKMNAGDKFARTSPDGRIWYCAARNAAAQAEILAVDFPENEAAGPNAGIVPTPVWYFGVNGIMRNR